MLFVRQVEIRDNATETEHVFFLLYSVTLGPTRLSGFYEIFFSDMTVFFFSLFKHIVLLIFQEVMPIKGLRGVQVRVQLKYTYDLRKYRFVNISKTFKSCPRDFFFYLIP